MTNSKCQKIKELQKKVELITDKNSNFTYSEKIYNLRLIRSELIKIMIDTKTCRPCLRDSKTLMQSISMVSLN